MFLSLVRTNAPPFPGFTCWKYTIWNRCPSISSTNPFLKSAVVATDSPMGAVRHPKRSEGRCADRGRGRLHQLDQLRSSVGQTLWTIGTEIDIVLQPHPTPPRKIDARLDGDYRMHRQRAVGRRRQTRRLVHLESETVSQRVAERVAEAARRDDLPGKRVTLPAGHSGPEMLQRPLLRASHQVVHGALPLVGACPDHQGTGEIGAVSVHL